MSKTPSAERLPIVAIIGRPNVGKSSLFNRFVGSRIAIEDPRPGTTRDRVSFQLNLGNRRLELIDAAGIGVIDEDRLEEHIEEQIQFAIEQADVLLFVVDVKDGILPLDQRVASIVRKLEKPTLLVANKADAPHQDSMAGVFHKLGVGQPICISCAERRGIKELQQDLLEALPERSTVEDSEHPTMKLAIIGKRNSGKSSLINALAEDERLIVSEVAGTTRDSVDVHFMHKGMEFIAIDTAGIQRQRSIENSVEFYSQARSIKAIRRADVVVHMMDCLETTSKLDRKLAEEAIKELKPIIIAVNKWDLAGEVTTERYQEYINARMPMLRYAPVVYMSVKNGMNVHELVDLALDLHRQSHFRVTTGELNRAVRAAFDRHRPKGKYGKPPKLFYATQVETNPPTILVYVNEARIFGRDWREYLKNRLREVLPFREIPLKIIFKNRDRIDLDQMV